jgi:hypothetical protein
MRWAGIESFITDTMAHGANFKPKFGDRQEQWEVKSAMELADDELIRRTSFLTHALADCGFRYRFVVGEVLMQRPQV